MAELDVTAVEAKSLQRNEWRKKVKKLQRKRRRQKSAKERDRIMEEEERAKRNDPVYQEWLRKQEELAEHLRLAEEQQHQADEEAWLRRELLAQQQFARERKQREAKEADEAIERLQQAKELEERQAQRVLAKEERQRKQAETVAEFERTIQRMYEYLADPEMETPQELQQIVESRPGQKVCEFFERTNCCRFGLPCVFNHRKPLLSSIILITHFFTHPLMEQSENAERADDMLEFTEQDIRNDYDAFFDDVVPEMESFGKILNFRTVRNHLAYLRGHVFVEYLDKRSALKAFIKLQGRYYASKRLNVEFSNLRTWRGAICGLSVNRKCTKGNNCAYLHLFKNPGNKYNTLLECSKASPFIKRNAPSQTPKVTSLLSWNDIDKLGDSKEKPRSWRWSESPEVEIRDSKQKQDLKDVIKAETKPRRSRVELKEKHKSPCENDKRERKTSRSKSRSKSKSNREHKRKKRKRSKSSSRERSKRH